VAAAAVLPKQSRTRTGAVAGLQVDVEVADLERCSGTGGRLMITKRSSRSGGADKLIGHQARLLKAPRIAAHYHRLAEQGREAN
jgi:hypothetical protein